MYDKFLPHLVSHLETESLVLDIGANVGDSLAAMYLANPKLNFICFEPEEVYYQYLIKVRSRLLEFGFPGNITTKMAFVGLNIAKANLTSKQGTAKATFEDIDSSQFSSQSLDAILQGSPLAKLRLIKSDVDGFDYDVIFSANNIIGEYKPMIFFECMVENLEQKDNFLSVFRYLIDKKYTDFFIFDNYGQYILKVTSTQGIQEIIEYIWRQRSDIGTRTFWYFDVLAVVESDRDFASQIVADYHK